MYQAHFGLKKALFDSGIAQGASVYLGAQQQAVLANAKVALSTLDSVLVLTGAAGVGKTALASAALRESSTRLALGWLCGTPANASELLDLLLAELGVDAPRAGRMERLQMWRQFLNESNATSSRVFVIVERADDMNAALLRSLESFTAADPNGCAGANVVLLGGDALAEQLKAPALDSLRQRIRLRQKVEPLGLDDLRAYLEQHVTLAGGAFDKVFAADAVGAVHRYTGGIPRLVNNLCETALTLAATSGTPQVAGELVASAATTLLGLEDVTTVAPPAERAARESQPQEQQRLAASAPTTEPATASAAQIPAAAAELTAAAPLSLAKPMTLPAQTALAAAEMDAVAAPAPPAVTPPAAAARATPVPRAAATPAAAARPPSAAPGRPAAAQVPPPARAPAIPAAAPPAAPKLEFSGDATDIVADELLTATLVNETPDVAMAEFPVLTDAVEAPEPRRSPAKPAAAAAAARPGVPPAAKSGPPVPPAPARKPAAAPPPRAAKPALGAQPPAPQPAASPDEEDHGTRTMRALAVAKSIDDISSSMAETLFGEADLDMLSSALAAGDWAADDDAAQPPAEPPAADTDGLDLFDLGPDAPLELIDDASLPPQVNGRKLISSR